MRLHTTPLKIMESDVTLDSIKQRKHFCEFCKGPQRGVRRRVQYRICDSKPEERRSASDGRPGLTGE